MKERRQVKERIREQQCDRSNRQRPSAAQVNARRQQELATSMLADACRLPLPRVANDTFDRLVRLTQACIQASRLGKPCSLELSRLSDAWEAVLPGHELPVTGKIYHGTATSTQKDGTEEVTDVYIGDGVNEITAELRKESCTINEGHLEYTLAVGYNRFDLDGVKYTFVPCDCPCTRIQVSTCDIAYYVALGHDPHERLMLDDPLTPYMVDIDLQGI